MDKAWHFIVVPGTRDKIVGRVVKNEGQNDMMECKFHQHEGRISWNRKTLSFVNACTVLYCKKEGIRVNIFPHEKRWFILNKVKATFEFDCFFVFFSPWIFLLINHFHGCDVYFHAIHFTLYFYIVIGTNGSLLCIYLSIPEIKKEMRMKGHILNSKYTKLQLNKHKIWNRESKMKFYTNG